MSYDGIPVAEQIIMRHNKVLLRKTTRDVVGNIQLAATAAGAAVYTVVKAGSKCEGLFEGDEVCFIGQFGVHYTYLPNSSDLIVIDDDNVIGVLVPSPSRSASKESVA